MFRAIDSGPAVAIIPKCGTQSIGYVMHGATAYTNDEAIKLDKRVAFIRDPFDRLGSAYSFFHFLKQKDIRSDPPITWDGYETFVDWVLTTEDPHVKPQYEQLLTSDGIYVPTHTYPLKEIRNIWEDLYPGMIPDPSDFPHRHGCTRLEMTSYRRKDLEEHYSKDIELWHQF